MTFDVKYILESEWNTRAENLKFLRPFQTIRKPCSIAESCVTQSYLGASRNVYRSKQNVSIYMKLEKLDSSPNMWNL